MKMKKNLKVGLGVSVRLASIGLVAVIAATSTVCAQITKVSSGELTKVGLSGGQFLKIGVGARASGMAGAYSGISDDLSSIYWNPAGVVAIKDFGAEFSQTFWFAGTLHSFAAAVVPISERFRLAASFTGFSSGDIQATTLAEPTGSGKIYSVNDIALGLTFAGQLTEQFSFGITTRYINQAFSNMSASGLSFDIGTKYITGFNGVSLGFAVNNLGTSQAYDGSDITQSSQPTGGLNQSVIDYQAQTSSFSIPLSFRAGLGIDMFQGFIADAPEVDDGGVEIHNWIIGADFETFADVPEQFAIGTEYTFREFVSLRAGYRFGNDEFGMSGGIGIKYISGAFLGRFDYSISPSTNLGLVNRLTVAVNFD